MHKGVNSSTASGAAVRDHKRLILALASLSSQERSRALKTFEHLLPGDSLEIVATQRLGGLVAELQAGNETRFYAWPLERGPLEWRVILAKPALDAPTTVAAVMKADHLRLCRLWGELERAAELRQIDHVQRCLAELSLGLRRDIHIEELVLFPLLEMQTGMNAAGLTKCMQTEHRRFVRILDHLDRLRVTTECAAIFKMSDRPVASTTLFQQHCLSEEAALYPLIDVVFDAGEERELFSLIQAFEI
jgi:uncharacterized protein (DUF2249 family)